MNVTHLPSGGSGGPTSMSAPRHPVTSKLTMRVSGAGIRIIRIARPRATNSERSATNGQRYLGLLRPQACSREPWTRTG